MFDPLMEELGWRGAVVFIHPGPIPGPPVETINVSLADFLLDTTLATINLVQHDIPHRFPRLKIILSHGGGFVPYTAYRIAALSNVIDETVQPERVLDDLSSFYFDTALSGSPTALPSLMTFARSGRVLFGSDWPYCPNRTVSFITDHSDAYEGLDDDDRHDAINRKNAEQLFPRLAEKAA